MELYHNNMSSCAQKVRIVLLEKRLQPQLQHIDLRAGEQNHPDYRRLNPAGVVPTLVDGGQAIVESAVICEYLEDAYPAVPLRPTDPALRARMRQWTLMPDAGLHRAVGLTSVSIAFRHQMRKGGDAAVARMLAARPDPRNREELRALLEYGLDAPGVDQGVRYYERFVERLARRLDTHAWLAGDQFSLADAMAVPYVVRLEHLGMQWWWEEPQRQRGTIIDWLMRCKARASFAAISDHLDAGYLELMARTGKEAQARVAAILAAP